MKSMSATKEPWHCLNSRQVQERLEVSLELGLRISEVGGRQTRFGMNHLLDKPPRSAWMLFISQFRNMLIVMLVLAALLAGLVGELKDTVVILTVVVLNALFGFYQEYRAEQSLSALKKMLPQTSCVRRDGRKQEIPAEQLVPGDIVLLEAGDRVPADGRLLVAITLEVNESALTGESEPVVKQVVTLSERNLPLAERANMLYMNTMVTRGRAELLVTETGMGTEMGKISAELAESEERKTPLQIQLDRLGKQLAVIAGILVSILFLVDLVRGEPLSSIILDAIALAVAAMPEGLPAVVTVTLALGMQRMARNKAILKRLVSVETLGATTIICSDKTGTLTLNRMTVREIYCQEKRIHIPEAKDIALPEGELARIALLCNDAVIRNGQVVGDPMEGALLLLADKAGFDKQTLEREMPRLAEIPFDSAHKFMATAHFDKSGVKLYVKGAPEILLDRCHSLQIEQGVVPLTEVRRRILRQEARDMATQGLRLLLLGYREVDRNSFQPGQDLKPLVGELIVAGIVGLQDPPRPEAGIAIELCRQAGVQVKMITGDHPDTAVAIARELGLKGHVLTGQELDRMDPGSLAERVEESDVFARVVPEHKVRLVRALKAKGHVVAMTGDGVNDAPALKCADIGIAMGITGTEVTKEAAAMVLTDDNFATIVKAIKEGRTLYDNILKFIRFQLSTTIGAVLTVFFAPLLGLPEPFNPVQILWVAMIMDGPPAVALALDTARPGIMEDPPRNPGAQILPVGRVLHVLWFGSVMTAGTLGTLYYKYSQGNSAQEAATLAFTTFVLFQFFNVFNARVEKGSAFNRKFFHNKMLWWSLAGVIFLQVLAVQWPLLQQVFNTVALGGEDWLLAIGVAAMILVVEEVRKLVVLSLGNGRIRQRALQR